MGETRWLLTKREKGTQHWCGSCHEWHDQVYELISDDCSSTDARLCSDCLPKDPRLEDIVQQLVELLPQVFEAGWDCQKAFSRTQHMPARTRHDYWLASELKRRVDELVVDVQ